MTSATPLKWSAPSTSPFQVGFKSSSPEIRNIDCNGVQTSVLLYSGQFASLGFRCLMQFLGGKLDGRCTKPRSSINESVCDVQDMISPPETRYWQQPVVYEFDGGRLQRVSNTSKSLAKAIFPATHSGQEQKKVTDQPLPQQSVQAQLTNLVNVVENKTVEGLERGASSTKAKSQQGSESLAQNEASIAKLKLSQMQGAVHLKETKDQARPVPRVEAHARVSHLATENRELEGKIRLANFSQQAIQATSQGISCVADAVKNEIHTAHITLVSGAVGSGVDAIMRGKSCNEVVDETGRGALQSVVTMTCKACFESGRKFVMWLSPKLSAWFCSKLPQNLHNISPYYFVVGFVQLASDLLSAEGIADGFAKMTTTIAKTGAYLGGAAFGSYLTQRTAITAIIGTFGAGVVGPAAGAAISAVTVYTVSVIAKQVFVSVMPSSQALVPSKL